MMNKIFKKKNNFSSITIKSDNLKGGPRRATIMSLNNGNYENILKEKIAEQNDNNDENFKNLKNIPRRKSMAIMQHLNKFIIDNDSISKDYILSILEKIPKNRKENEIKDLANYFSSNYSYFKKLKKTDSQLKVEKLAKVAKIKLYYPGEIITKYGYPDHTFYIVLEGFVKIYKPFFEEINATPNEFLKYIKNIKLLEKDLDKYSRIKEYNKTKNLDIEEYEKKDPNLKIMNKKTKFYVEKLKSDGIYGEGFSFGEFALNTNDKGNATIRCSEENKNKQVILLLIGKEAYDKAIKEYQEKKLNQEVEDFISTFPFFKDFSKEKIVSLFKCINKINLEKGDYLFHQNDEDTNLYLIIKGKFELYCHISLCWINKFMEYIINMRDNLLGHLYIQRPKKMSDILIIIKEIEKKKIKSPMIFEEIQNFEKLGNSINENNLMGIKFEEEKLNENRNKYKIKLQNIDKPELLGIENSFEFKNKFYTIKCVSETAEVKSIKIMDFIRLISNFKMKEINYLIDYILEKKNILGKQIITSMKTIQYKIISNLEMKYERLLKSDGKKLEDEKNENNINKTLSVIKAKGYKSGINDILDEETNILDEKPTKIINHYLFRHKKPSKMSIKLKKKQEFVDFVFSNKTKLIKSAKDIYKNNKENLLILKKYMDTKNSCFKNIKKFNSTKTNIKDFLLNKNINNLSFYKPNSESISLKNDFSMNNSINDNRFTNSFLINSNFFYKKMKQIKSHINKENLKNSNRSNYLTYVNTKLNKKKFTLKSLKSNMEDKSKYKPNIVKSELIESIEKNGKKIFNKTNNIFLYRKLKNNDNNDSIINKDNNNISFLNRTDIKLNKFQKMNINENKKMLKNSSTIFNKSDIYGSVNNNKKEFFLEPDFSKKFESINEYKNKKNQSHHFPVLKK